MPVLPTLPMLPTLPTLTAPTSCPGSTHHPHGMQPWMLLSPQLCAEQGWDEHLTGKSSSRKPLALPSCRARCEGRAGVSCEIFLSSGLLGARGLGKWSLPHEGIGWWGRK